VILVAGLGNPGARYAATRHNIGFCVADALADRHRAGPWRAKFQGELTDCEISGERVLLLKPQTYMNESGRSVRAALGFYKLGPGELFVIHDELDLPFGVLRLKQGGGHAGHNGIRSIVEHLQSPEFSRLRCGIGHPPPEFQGSGADYVLQAFALADRRAVEELIERAVQAFDQVLRTGLDAAMNVINRTEKP